MNRIFVSDVKDTPNMLPEEEHDTGDDLDLKNAFIKYSRNLS